MKFEKFEKLDDMINTMEEIETRLEDVRKLYRDIFGIAPSTESFPLSISDELDLLYAQRARLQREAAQNA